MLVNPGETRKQLNELKMLRQKVKSQQEELHQFREAMKQQTERHKRRQRKSSSKSEQLEGQVGVMADQIQSLQYKHQLIETASYHRILMLEEDLSHLEKDRDALKTEMSDLIDKREAELQRVLATSSEWEAALLRKVEVMVLETEAAQNEKVQSDEEIRALLQKIQGLQEEAITEELLQPQFYSLRAVKAHNDGPKIQKDLAKPTF